jgi:hypothetical protein
MIWMHLRQQREGYKVGCNKPGYCITALKYYLLFIIYYTFFIKQIWIMTSYKIHLKYDKIKCLNVKMFVCNRLKVKELWNGLYYVIYFKCKDAVLNKEYLKTIEDIIRQFWNWLYVHASNLKCETSFQKYN